MNNDIEYIEYFNKLEQHLKNKYKIDKHLSFVEILNKHSNDHDIKPFLDELREHAQLRNIISHKRGTEYFAFPTDVTLQSLIRIYEAITKPKKVYDLIKSRPMILDGGTKITDVLDKIKETGYSQFPVYYNETYLGLLTTNTISIWISKIINRNGEIMEDINDVSVKDILEYGESTDQAIFLHKTINVNEFIDRVSKTNLTKVWIITETGSKNQKPLRLITAYDYENIFMTNHR